MLEAAHPNRPHGDEWRWRLGPARSTPSISVTVTSPPPNERSGHNRAFGFARELADEAIEPLLWEGD
jgi:hypothetical protein